MAKKNKSKYRQISAEKHAPVNIEGKGDMFNPDYSDVIKDLKRIGILAGSFFIVLIALAFVLR